MVEEDVERQVDKQDHFHHNVQESPIIIRPNAPSLTKPLVISYVLSAILICLLGAGGFMVYRNADISVLVQRDLIMLFRIYVDFNLSMSSNLFAYPVVVMMDNCNLVVLTEFAKISS